MEINKTTCYCCSVVNKLSPLDYLDLQTYPSTDALKHLPRRKKCYLDFSNFSSLAADSKAALSSRFGCSENENDRSSTSNQDCLLGKSKVPSTSRNAGEEESSQHICRICENSEAASIHEHCLFKNFDGFAQHMSLRHNTSVIRITTKSTRNCPKAETDEAKLFKIPEVPTNNNSLSNIKNFDGSLGRGQINHNPLTKTLSSNVILLNGNCNRSYSAEVSAVLDKKPRKNDNECNYLNTSDPHLGGSVIISHRNVNVNPVKKQWTPENDVHIQERRDSVISSTGFQSEIQVIEKLGNNSSISFKTEGDSENNLQDMNNETNLGVSRLNHFPKEHFEVSKLVKETGRDGKCLSLNSVQMIVNNVKGKHDVASTFIREYNVAKNSQIHEKRSTFLNQTSNAVESLSNVDASSHCVNNLPKNKCFLSEYDTKTQSCIRDGTRCKQILPKSNGPKMPVKYTNIPGITTTFGSKNLPSDAVNIMKPNAQITLSQCTGSTGSGLVSQNNCMKSTSGEGDYGEKTQSSTLLSIGSGKRKRGRPPKKAGTLSQINIVAAESFKKPSSKTPVPQNGLFEENESLNSYCNTDKTVLSAQDGRQVEIKGNVPQFIEDNGEKSETTAQLLQKHIINRKIFCKVNKHSQNSKHGFTGSSEHATPSRLSDRIQNHHKAAKERSEHLRKVEFLSALGLIETSSVLAYPLSQKSDIVKNTSLNIKTTTMKVKNVFPLNKCPNRKEVSLPDHGKTEPPPKRRRGRPPKKISTSINKVVYNEKPDLKITSLFVPVRKNKSHAESSRSTGRTRKTSQKYSDYVCYY